MPGKTPSTRMTMGRAQAQKAASRGPNPDDRTQGRMKIPGPARFSGTVSASKGPIAPDSQTGPKPFFIMTKPLSSDKGNPAKKI